jgi:hypothetical protein
VFVNGLCLLACLLACLPSLKSALFTSSPGHGDAFSAGYNDQGQLGYRGSGADQPLPLPIAALRDRIVLSVSCGKAHALAIIGVLQLRERELDSVAY